MDFNFDATKVDPKSEYSPIPVGTYTVMLIDSVWKDTKAGDGRYVKLTFEVADEGDLKGRRIYENLNLVNKNPTAVAIANRKLSAICHAVGVMQLTDTAQLHFKPFKVKVGISKDGSSNEVKDILFKEKVAPRPVTDDEIPF
jgi:hypothetical protein